MVTIDNALFNASIATLLSPPIRGSDPSNKQLGCKLWPNRCTWLLLTAYRTYQRPIQRYNRPPPIRTPVLQNRGPSPPKISC